MSNRDVEAPEVFQATEKGLWDGRPSLGGVWIAHPDVTGPERVLIRNENNGKTVVGALFKRERDNPGPRFQVSSDAAAALGLLAGQPTILNVTALKRKESQTAAEPKAETEVEAASAQTTEGETSTETTNTTEPAKPGWNPFRRKSTAATAATAAVAADAATETAPASEPADAAPQASATPQKKSWNPFRKKSQQPAASAAVASEASPAEPAAASTSSLAKPYVQIGVFPDQQGATAAAQKMKADDLSASVVTSGGSYRVLVGPAESEQQRSANLAKVKALGYSDAYTVGG